MEHIRISKAELEAAYRRLPVKEVMAMFKIKNTSNFYRILERSGIARNNDSTLTGDERRRYTVTE